MPPLAITATGSAILVLLALVGLTCVVAGHRSLRVHGVGHSGRRQWWLVLLLMVVLPLGLFGLLAHAVGDPQGISWDVSIMQHILLNHSQAVERVMRVITDTGGVLGVSLLLAAATAGLLFARLYRAALFLLTTTVAAMVVNALLKQVFERARPEIIPHYRISGYSFPSGHTAGAMAFALAVLVVLHVTRWRWPLAIAVVSWAVAVGVSRVYLGVHYPSDVLAGWAIAASVAGISWLAFWTELEPDASDAGVESAGRSPVAASPRTRAPDGGDALSGPAGTDEPTLSSEE